MEVYTKLVLACINFKNPGLISVVVNESDSSYLSYELPRLKVGNKSIIETAKDLLISQVNIDRDWLTLNLGEIFNRDENLLVMTYGTYIPENVNLKRGQWATLSMLRDENAITEFDRNAIKETCVAISGSQYLERK